MKFLRLSLLAFLAWIPQAFALETREIQFEGKRITVTEVDLKKDRLQLFLNDDHGKPFNRFARLNDWLGERQLKLRWAMNAGMYQPDYSAVGLFVADGQQIAPINLKDADGNFFMKPNAVFYVAADGAAVLESNAYARLHPKAILATQSGPALVLDGHLHGDPQLYRGRTEFKAGSPNRLHRNGVGVADANKVFFAITEDPVNFDEFARMFRDKLGCQNALFLDGTVSCLHDSALNRSDKTMNVGPIIGITEPR